MKREIPFVKPDPGHFEKMSELLIPDKPVEVYRNLHKTECWSVRQRQDGRMLVRFHCSYIMLRDCSFVVRPAGYANVVRTGVKEVHAFVKGILTNPCRTITDENGQQLFDWSYDAISYNPKKGPTFYVREDNRPTLGAKWVDMGFDGDSADVLAFCP